MSESKRTAPRWYCVDRDGVAMLCANRRDALAQAAENDDCWPQRAPYQAVLLGDVSALAAEVERLKAENDKLRAKLGNSPEPCAYCGIPAGADFDAVVRDALEAPKLRRAALAAIDLLQEAAK